MGLLDFIERGRERRAWLDDKIGGAVEYLTPPNLRPVVALGAQMNPIQGMSDSMSQFGVAVDPSRSMDDRRRAAMNSLVEGALAVTPAAVAKFGYMKPAQATMEGLLGWSPAAQQIGDDLGQFLVDEAGNIRVWHGSPNEISGSLRHGGKDVGAHVAANPDLARNASIKSLLGDHNAAEKVKVFEFSLDAAPEQIAEISGASNRFDFFDILEDLHGTGRISEDSFNAIYDGLEEIEGGSGHYDAIMEQMNAFFSRELAGRENIRALKYHNEFDAGPNWLDFEAGRYDSDVAPDASYILLDPSVASNRGLLAEPSLPTPRNEAEAMARDVLDLRGAGRASEVTEDMMAAADPSYMFRNTPLDMSQEARMARLDEYWPTDAYHSTRATSQFDRFQPGARGSVYLSNSPENAAKGAAGQNLENPYSPPAGASSNAVMPLRINPDDVKGLSLNRNGFDALPEKIETEGGIAAIADQVRDAGLEYWDDAYIQIPNRSGEGFTYYKNSPEISGYGDIEAGRDAFGYRLPSWNSGSDVPGLDRAAKSGKRAFMVADEAGSSIVASPDMPIRSIFARADPEFRHLANLSAGLGGIGLLGSMNRDDLDRETAAYLGGI